MHFTYFVHILVVRVVRYRKVIIRNTFVNNTHQDSVVVVANMFLSNKTQLLINTLIALVVITDIHSTSCLDLDGKTITDHKEALYKGSKGGHFQDADTPGGRSGYERPNSNYPGFTPTFAQTDLDGKTITDHKESLYKGSKGGHFQDTDTLGGRSGYERPNSNYLGFTPTLAPTAETGASDPSEINRGSSYLAGGTPSPTAH